MTSSNGPSLAEREFWDDYAVNGADFSAGDPADDGDIQIGRLREQIGAFGLWNPEKAVRQLVFGDEDVADQILNADEEEDFLAEIIRDAAERSIDGQHDQAHSSPEWFPYPSKMMFLLDTWDNLRRLRISSSLMRVFLWILKEAGCKNVPSFDGLRRVQNNIRSDIGIPSIPCVSPLGNIFFMNDPRAIITQDWSNPTTRKLIHVYPEIPEDGIIREIWHVQKWRKDMDLDCLSPMFDAGISHYYVNELSRLKNGDFIVPIRWVKFRGKVYCDAYSVTLDEKNEATIFDTETSLICTDDLANNYLNLKHAGAIPKWSESTIQSGHTTRMPNPKCEIAGGDPLYTSFIDYFGDDVSGNRTKSWNKHWNAYFTHRNLPRKLLQQEFHFREFKIAVESTHAEPVRVEDETGKATRFCIHVNGGPSDNPMQSEVTGHIGGKGNHFCRKCKVGGTQKEKASDDGYHALFEAGTPRTKDHIVEELEKQVKLACSGVASHFKDSQARTGVKDAYTQHWIDDLITRFKELKQGDLTRTDADIQAELVGWTLTSKDKIYSGFLTMKGFDPTKDTPVEILHTIPLGIVKYIWHVSHTPWSAEQKQRYSVCLQATETDGLSIPPIRANYIMQYAGSLIGRQLKTIAQTNAFHVYDIASEPKFIAWKAMGELSALLWFPEIRNLAEYRADLKVAVANVLDIFATIDPSKIITKIEYHLLTHLDDDAVAFGPLVGAAAEIYESFNAIFRLAGPGVRHFLQAHPVLKKLLGWSEGKTLKHGMLYKSLGKYTDEKFLSQRGEKNRIQSALKTTAASHALNFGKYNAESLWNKCRSVVSESLDECFVGSWVFAKVVLKQVESLKCGADETFGMPVLVRRDGETTFLVIPAKHSCHTAEFESDNTEKYIEHNPVDRFIINSHAFHNTHLLRAALPQALLAPLPLFEDRQTKHHELVAELREKQETRCAK
ncbi:hypothetical protein DFH08DRAFT_914975 [Mycena albidolilacea]|uniref:Uncharacterized protein n=1 Tax=Mycena albidolilacea TaxID=1033008 RepID=A0AAD6ZZA0_9AGAR|nr:hypothetical protein DFH08DRAFT_914975 [Mycena albidolilacea]